MYKIYTSSLRIHKLIYEKRNRPRRGIIVDNHTMFVAVRQYRRLRSEGVSPIFARAAITQLIGLQAVKF